MGRALLPLLPKGWEVIAPRRPEVDLTRPETLDALFAAHRPEVVLHLAAYTDVARAEREREACWRVNVEGTRALARRAPGWFVHLSTDYVFDGERGMYREEDLPNPKNFYALSKTVGEEAARQAPRPLIVRTSFKTAPWPYPRAFVDQFTSADYVDVIARELLVLLQHLDRVPGEVEVLHIATERKSIYDLARRRTPGVQPMRRAEAPVYIPPDVSLDTTRWQRLKAGWGV